MSVYDDMARDAGYRGDEAAQVARALEQHERRRSETGCGCSALELHDGRCAGCGRSVLERVSRPGRPGADYEIAHRTVGGVELALQTDSPREDAERERLLAERERQLERREGEVAMREAALGDV
jgi:hypothetical protein